MAIYTQYGRYTKAKLFKESVNSGGGVYFAFGIGNPDWDSAGVISAPYDEKCTFSLGTYFDNQKSRYYKDSSNVVKPLYASLATNASTKVPLFPVIYNNATFQFEIASGAGYVGVTSYKDAYITKTGSEYILHYQGNDTSIKIPSATYNPKEFVYFCELFIRGTARADNCFGLLGMVKGDACLVKDIGNSSTGAINEFYYGDRYWKVVDDSDADSEMPCHVLLSASIEPKMLCDDAEVDLGMIARQVAIYHKKTSALSSVVYKPKDYVFDFGQASGTGTSVLNFRESNPEFEFILNDYIKGSSRRENQVDRYGYVVGF